MSMLGIDCEDWVADAGGAMSIPGIEAWSMPFIASSGLVGACGDGLRAGVGFPCRRSCFFTPGFFATAFLAAGFCGVGICIPGMLIPWCREWSCASAGRSEERRVGKDVSERVDLGGRSSYKKKQERIIIPDKYPTDI